MGGPQKTLNPPSFRLPPRLRTRNQNPYLLPVSIITAIAFLLSPPQILPKYYASYTKLLVFIIFCNYSKNSVGSSGIVNVSPPTRYLDGGVEVPREGAPLSQPDTPPMRISELSD